MGALVLGAALVAYPFWPLVRYTVAPPTLPRLPYPADISAAVAAETKVQPAKAGAVIPSGNRLAIPAIGVNMRIVEGPPESVLSKGAWHIPGTSIPPEGGNTVISGHRWQYRSGSNTLYLADRVKIGDLMVVYCGGKSYAYRVTETKLVDPNDVYIHYPSENAKLTVYTCAPLFSTTHRLVLIGEPV